MSVLIKRWFNATALILTLLFAGANALSQGPTDATQKAESVPFAGKYEGMVKDETGEAKLTLDVVEESGKFSGTLTTPRGVFKIIEGQVADSSLTLRIERPEHSSGLMTLRYNGNNLTASFSDGGKNLTVELRKIVADEISGEWDAAADAQGQAFPFTLSLKLDGEKVTGSSSSQLGNSQISTGTWKDGKLTLVLDSGGGPIGLVATLDGGKLIGDYDYAGQLQGKWVAVRKK